jgi:preprotein translocase subunit SecY
MSCDLARRIAVTLGAVLVYLIGACLPLPGVAVSAWVQSPECDLCLY